MMARIFYHLLCLLIISGCATTQNIQKPTTSLPAQGMARISLERENIAISDLVRMEIKDNDQIVGNVATGGRLIWDRPQGTMKISVNPMWDGTFKYSTPSTINVASGNIYHIRLTAAWDDTNSSFLKKQSKAVFALQHTEKLDNIEVSATKYVSNNSKNKLAIPSSETSEDSSEKQSLQLSIAIPSSEYKDRKADSLPSTTLGKYYALLVGINDYKHLPKLQTAKNDARVVRDILRDDYGFEVELLLDASRSDILLSLGKLRERLASTDNLLIYYAGHGWLDKDGDEGYWLPSDASQNNEVNWVSNASVTTALKAMMAKHVLVVADSCYSGKLGRSVHIRMRNPDYYSRLSQKRARSVISSGGLEPVIDSGGKGSHSVFASAFIQALQDNKAMMDSTELFSNIRRPIMLNSDQTPEYSDIRKADHDGGEFIFVRINR